MSLETAVINDFLLMVFSDPVPFPRDIASETGDL